MENAKRFQVVRVRKKEKPTTFSYAFLYPKHDFCKSHRFLHASTVASTVHLLCIYCASTVHLLFNRGISRIVRNMVAKTNTNFGRPSLRRCCALTRRRVKVDLSRRSNLVIALCPISSSEYHSLASLIPSLDNCLKTMAHSWAKLAAQKLQCWMFGIGIQTTTAARRPHQRHS